MQSTEHGRQHFFELRDKHYNKNLADFTTNANEMQRIIEYDNRLYQKTDPVYLDPRYSFIKSHFYAPRKSVFGMYVDTFWVNVAVLWIITLITFFVLYFRLLKRTFDFFEKVTGRIHTIKEFKKRKKEEEKRLTETTLKAGDV